MGRKIEVHPGDVYGKLTIIKEVEPYVDSSGNTRRMALCQCSCGSDPVKKRLTDLNSGKTTSCGCIRENKKITVKPGEKYGRLTVVREIEPYIDEKGRKFRQVLCTCSCDGKEVKVKLGNLKNGKTTSCGCYKKELVIDKNKKANMFLIHVPSNTVIGYTTKMERFYFDREDLPLVEQCCWHIDKHGYVVGDKDGHKIKLHRFITNPSDNRVIDHINRNKADCRKINLRECDQFENNRNKGLISTNTSGVTGVYWHKKTCKWRATIGLNNKIISLGYFSNKQEAIEARLKAELELYGTFSPNYQKLTQQQSNQQSQQNT